MIEQGLQEGHGDLRYGHSEGETSMTTVNLQEASMRLPDLIAAALRGEDVVIAEDSQSAVKLVPVPKSRQRRRPGNAKGQIQMAEDFDAPVEDFREHMQ